jgi:hypothetical protein
MKAWLKPHFSKQFPIALVIFLAGCAGNPEGFPTTDELNPFFPGGSRQQQGEAIEDTVSYWNGEGMGGRPSIKIDLGAQRAYFYRGGQLAGVSIVSTGREGHDTPPGKFHVTDKDIDHASSLYGDYVDPSGQVVVPNVQNKKDPRPPGTVFRGASMPYFLRIHGEIGVHAGYLPGYPASHGCIRIPETMAEKFYQYAPIGTPVEVH